MNTTGHLWMRVIGLVGVLSLGAGFVLLEASGRAGAGLTIALLAFAIGIILLGFALRYEFKSAHASVRSARGRMGSTAFLQVLLALVLLIGVNVFSFHHNRRFDWTRDSDFSELRRNPAFRNDLARLIGETRIVVFKGGRPFGQLAEKQDNYAAAASRKIIAKVRDNVEQFQDLGPRFRVDVLDITDDDYQAKLKNLKEEAPQLAKAIDTAPEDSIFFYADGRVQRLAFHDIYQLDRKESQEAEDGRGNLVLRYQGVEPFARKVLNIEEKRPRIGVGVVHEVLGLEYADDFNKELGMAGVKKALHSRGFDTRDIILKKWGEGGPPEPAVLTYGESRFERLENEISELDDTIKARKEAIEELEEEKKFWTSGTEEEANKRVNKRKVVIDEDDRYFIEDRLRVEAFEKKTGRKVPTVPITSEIRKQYVKMSIETPLALHQLNLQRAQEERNLLAKEQSGLNIEDISEQRRITDLRAKLNRMLADCDMLIVPRATLFNVARKERIPNAVYKLEDAQIDAIRDFMRAGKPVLFCLGPSNDVLGEVNPLEAGSDRLESLLTDLGFRLPKQTVLFNVETKSFGERRGALLILGSTRVEVPPVEFDWKPGGRPGVIDDAAKGNPIRTSIGLAARSVGKGQGLELRLRHPRPVYLADAAGKSKDDAVFLMTNPDAWNESQPFPTRERTPRYEPPKKDDPDAGTLRARRQGQFPIGVAAEVNIPASWSDSKDKDRPSAKKDRVAVIGHGSVFSGPTLNPVQEKLLLDVTNWLLGRDDLLARGERTWSFPRVQMSEQAISLWQWLAGLGLPLVFVLLGCVVLLVRRIR
ncbi:MAG: hypothetical protein FJ271_09480 [Planctomycetes bacterium]|nr:hypothetical protein [Planctomycetota bacterium]